MPAAFETRSFGFPFYRVLHFDEPRLRTELASVAGECPMGADCKVSAGDVAATHGLMRLGFRKVCVQITLRHDLTEIPEPQCSEVRIAGRLDLDDETLWAHARNFTQDRFSLDPLMPATGRRRLYHQWFRNSLGGAKQVAYIGADVCTFSQQGGDVIVDLVSVLHQRRGNGSRLLTTVLAHARQSGASSVRVKTECENPGAWSLYQRKRFVPVAYTSVFHLVSAP
jgi:GNAT superfamily N-acetyltransferase